MKQKTKIAYMLVLIGFLILVIGTALTITGVITFGSDASLVMVFILAAAFVLIVIGGHMLKVRFNRWMDND